MMQYIIGKVYSLNNYLQALFVLVMLPIHRHCLLQLVKMLDLLFSPFSGPPLDSQPDAQKSNGNI